MSQYVDSTHESSPGVINVEKSLKKLLTHAFTRIFMSNNYNLLAELLRSSKNIYTPMMRSNKLLQQIALIVSNKDKPLLKALSVLLGIEACNKEYHMVSFEDVSEFYFSIYFLLSSKPPTHEQFNIWTNHTSMQKLNSAPFLSVLGKYFNESKCLYLQLKIREFMGINENQASDGNYHIEMNPLMMYLLEVYLLEKKNYYDSYHELIQFLSQDNLLSL